VSDVAFARGAVVRSIDKAADAAARCPAGATRHDGAAFQHEGAVVAHALRSPSAIRETMTIQGTHT
jgi:hypothetical protein